VLREGVSDWFELDSESPYMLIVANVRKDRRRAISSAEKALFGIDKLNIAFRNSGGDARGLLKVGRWLLDP
jgi:carbamoyltransferase